MQHYLTVCLQNLIKCVLNQFGVQVANPDDITAVSQYVCGCVLGSFSFMSH